MQFFPPSFLQNALWAATAVFGAAWIAQQIEIRKLKASPPPPGADSDAPRRLAANPATLSSKLAPYFIPFFLVMLVRVFLAEPFGIPSGSMRPGMDDGDMILAEKISWGATLPWTQGRIFGTKKPQPGDIVVFRYPPDPDKFFVKRVVGLPGDIVEMKSGRLILNGVPSQYAPALAPPDAPENAMALSETFPGQSAAHLILVEPQRMARRFPFANHPDSAPYCVQDLPPGDFACAVPKGAYFAMGDNRENSADSRFWGFVPEANLVARPVFAFFTFNLKSGLPHLGPLK